MQRLLKDTDEKEEELLKQIDEREVTIRTLKEHRHQDLIIKHS
jgi:hypothetical protein